MTLRSVLVRLLDRRGGRSLLRWIANRYAMRLNGAALMRVFYDPAVRAWGREALGEVIVDGHAFPYFADHLEVRHGKTPWTAMAESDWFTRFVPRRGDTVLDIGAEVGSDIPAFVRAVGAEGRVVAVEAHPDTYRLLERTVTRNGYPQVTCVHAAIAGCRGETYIEDGTNTLCSTTHADGIGHRVATLSVDDLCASQRIGPIALLKMNIEGSERVALAGMRQALARTAHVCIACHDFRADRGEGEFYRTRDEVVAALRALGFVVADRATDAPLHVRDYVEAWRPQGAPSRAVAHERSRPACP